MSGTLFVTGRNKPELITGSKAFERIQNGRPRKAKNCLDI
jgi:hypothetical protein